MLGLVAYVMRGMKGEQRRAHHMQKRILEYIKMMTVLVVIASGLVL